MSTTVNKLKIIGEYDWQGGDEVRKQREDLNAGHKAGSGFGLSMGSIATAAAGMAAAVGAATLAASKYMIDAASEAQEMQGKFDTVFANVGDKVTEDLGEFANAVGRSRYELMGYAATLGDTLKPLGFAESAAGDLSSTLVKLATDLSSFNNMSMDEALQRLQGTLIGSHENALAFGVVINENTLKAELARMGAEKYTGTMLEQAKVQARINLLLQGTSDAQGDALRTSESWANQMRRLQSVLSDAATAAGAELLPALTPILKDITELAIKATPALVGAMKTLAPVIDDVAAVLHGVTGMLDKLEPATDKNTKTLKLFNAAAIPFVGDLMRIRQGLGWVAEKFRDAEEVMDSGTKSALDYYQSFVDGADNVYQAAIAAEDYTAKLQGMSDVQRDSRTYAEDEAWALYEVTQASRDAAAAGFERRDALKAQAAEQARLREEFALSQEAIGGYFATALEAEGASLSLEQQMFEMGKTAGLAASDLVYLAAATGDYTDEQIEAALKQALMKEKMAELMEEVKNGGITIHEAIAEAKDYQTGLDELVHPVKELRDQQAELNEQIAMLNGDFDASVNVETNGVEGLREAVALKNQLQLGTNDGRNLEVVGQANRNGPVLYAGDEAGASAATMSQSNTTNNNGNTTVNVYPANDDDLSKAMQGSGTPIP